MKKYYNVELIKALRSENMEQLIKEYVNNDFNAQLESKNRLDLENLTINIGSYMYNMFDMDEKTTMINNTIHNLGKQRKYDFEIFGTDEIYEKIEEKYCELYEIESVTDWGNTYNYGNDLSNDYQYKIFTIEDEYYILFQLHMFGDIRGNYNDTICLSIKDYDYLASGEEVFGFVEGEDNDLFNGRYEVDCNCTYNKELNKWFLNEDPTKEVIIGEHLDF